MKAFSAFLLLLLLLVSGSVIITAAAIPVHQHFSPQNEDDNNNNNGDIITKRSRKTTRIEDRCNLCKDANSVVGLPDQEVTQERTCGMMQLDGYNIRYDDDVCSKIQSYHRYCACTTSNNNNNNNQFREEEQYNDINDNEQYIDEQYNNNNNDDDFDDDIDELFDEEEESSDSIDIRPRDFDTGFRQHDTTTTTTTNNNDDDDSIQTTNDYDNGFHSSSQEQYNTSHSDDDDIYLKEIITADDDDTIMDIRTKDYDNGFRQHDNDVVIDVRDNNNSSSNSNIVEKSTKDDTNNNKNNDDKKKTHSAISHELARISGYIFLFGLVFGLSASTPITRLHHQLKNRNALLTGFCMTFVLIPFVGFLLVVLFSSSENGFTEAMGIILLVVASSPGGSYSNWCCAVFNSDIALSFAMTFVTTVVSILMLPLNLIMYTKIIYHHHKSNNDNINSITNTTTNTNDDDENVDEYAVSDYDAMFITLGLIVIALLSGYFVSQKITKNSNNKRGKIFLKVTEKFAFLSGIGLILVSSLLSSGVNGSTKAKFWNQHWSLYAGIFLLNVFAAFATHIVASSNSRLNKPECVTLSVECCYKNTAIAMSMALAMFPDPEQKAQALAVTIIYTLLQKIVMLIYCLLAWKLGYTYAPPDENLWKVITYSYNHHHHDNTDTTDIGKQHKNIKKDFKENEEATIDSSSSESSSSSTVSSLWGNHHCLPDDDREYKKVGADEKNEDVRKFQAIIKKKGHAEITSRWRRHLQHQESASYWWWNFFSPKEQPPTHETQINFPTRFGDV